MGLMDMLKTSDPMAKFYAAAEKSNVPQGGITGKLFSAMFPHGLGNLAFGREPEPMPQFNTPEGTQFMAELVQNVVGSGVTKIKTSGLMDALKNTAIKGADGSPLEVYHFTDAVFDKFDPAMRGKNSPVGETGYFFSPDREYASGYGANEIRAHVNIANPEYVFTKSGENELTEEAISRLKKEGKDGMVVAPRWNPFEHGDYPPVDTWEEVIPFDLGQIYNIK